MPFWGSFRLLCWILQEWRLEPVFTHHAHTACLSAVAANEQFVATGSKDETIQLYNMKTRTEHGALLHHDGERETKSMVTESYSNSERLLKLCAYVCRYYLVPGVWFYISLAEWWGRRPPVRVEHKNVGMSEIHQSSHVSVTESQMMVYCIMFCVVSWSCIFCVLCHRGHVTSLSMHPSGKLALSVGTDKKLR